MRRRGSAAGLPFLGAYGDLLFEKAGQRHHRRVRAPEDPRHRQGSGHRRAAVPGQRVRLQAALCVDTGYFETYNLPHVKLVDVSKTPIERFTAERHRGERRRVSARRDRLRDRLCGHDRLVRQDRDHRPRRQTAGREMARGPSAPISAWRRRAFRISSRSPARAVRRCWRA